MYEELQQFIGSGFFKTGSNNTMRFVVADKKGVRPGAKPPAEQEGAGPLLVLKLTNLMNGYLRTPKIMTFHRLIDKLNLLMGVKGLDYQDFKTVYSLILTKQHLTELGREEIKQIVANIRVRHNR